ncbi:hypothetical protein ABKV19_004512 [Rosa sericea]
MPNFSDMSNMRSLHLNHSFKLHEFPGSDKSLNSMILIRMERCTNITATGWRASGDGGIFLPEDDIPNWFAYVKKSDHVFFQVPPIIGYNLKALTVCALYSSCFNEDTSPSRISIFVTNHSKLISFLVQPAFPTGREIYQTMSSIWKVATLLRLKF